MQRSSKKNKYQEKARVEVDDLVSLQAPIRDMRDAHHPQPITEQIFMIVGQVAFQHQCDGSHDRQNSPERGPSGCGRDKQDDQKSNLC